MKFLNSVFSDFTFVNEVIIMKEICGIYCIENIINHKKYIGLSKNCYRRWYDHKNKAFNSIEEDDKRKPIYLAIRKYGLENFTFSIIEECPQEKLKEREIYWISYYDSYYNGYNATLGGDMPTGPAQKGEEHPRAKLTEEDVVFCRKKYAKGEACNDIYKQYFQNKIGIAGFQRMWFGKTWKHIMPEVFENNPRPRQKLTNEMILDIRTKYYQGMRIKEISEIYSDICSHTSIVDIVNNKRYENIQPDIKEEDKHKHSKRKLTDDEIRYIKQLKKQGKLNREIRELLGNKVSMTTISDILTGKRYSEIV